MTDREKILIFAGSLFLCISLFVISASILPENCLLYEYRQIGLLCDGLDLNNPQPCPVCRDESGATVSRIVFGLGVGSLLIPGMVYFIRWKRVS